MARAEGERTPEQRAAAAAERAARRAARDGGSAAPPPPETFAAGLRPASLDDHLDGDGREPAQEPVAARAASEVAAPEPVLEPEPAPQPESETEPAPALEPEPEPELEPPPDPSEPGRRRVRHQVASDRRRRVSAMAARTPARPSRLSASGRPQPPRRPARATGGHARRRVAALIALVVIAAALYLINAIFQPFHGDGTGSVTVSIPTGVNAGRIGDMLAQRGVVDNGTFFQLNATLTGRRGGLRPGDYTLRRGMSNGAAIDALTQGPKARVVKTINVTVPEGLSMREAAPLVDKGPLVGSYLKAARSPRTLQRARKLGAPRRVHTAEGFLFPATYTLVDGAPARNLVDRQLAAFSENMAKVDMSYAKRKNLTRYDVLTIASMVERETQSDKERPLIASVIYNRLKQGIPLGIDATIRYYENDWTRPLRESELQRDDPYNTRLNRGLPPTPIGNPGLASLKAAAHPATTDYIFYVAKPGTCGHAFSNSDAGFQRDVARYNAARAKAGGKSPTTC